MATTTTIMATTITMIERGVSGAALYRLMAWLSPSYPVGAFSYSHGLEQLVEDGAITDLASLNAWLADLLTLGSGRNDAILFVAAHRAATVGDLTALANIADHALAFAASAERHLETSAQGRAFAEITRTAWDSPTLSALLTPPTVMVGEGGPSKTSSSSAAPAQSRGWSAFADHDKVGLATTAYPVAVAIAAADHAIPLEPSLDAYLHGFAANLISAAVRLIPLGHTDGQRALRVVEPTLTAIAASAPLTTLADLASTTFLADMAAMRHETQYTRLFRS